MPTPTAMYVGRIRRAGTGVSAALGGVVGGRLRLLTPRKPIQPGLSRRNPCRRLWSGRR